MADWGRLESYQGPQFIEEPPVVMFKSVEAPELAQTVDMWLLVVVTVTGQEYLRVDLPVDLEAVALRPDLLALESRGEGTPGSLPQQFGQNALQVVLALGVVVAQNDQEAPDLEVHRRISAVEGEDPNHEIAT